jgi:hypothetical protein
MAPVYAALGLLYLIGRRKQLAEVAIFVGVQLLSVALRFLAGSMIYGSFMPSYDDNSAGIMNRFSFDLVRGTLTLFMDRQLGLLAWSPVYVFIFAGIVLLFVKERKLFWQTLLLALPYYLVIASWDDCGKGNSAPRYFVPIAFIFPMVVGLLYYRARDNVKIIFKIPAAASLALCALVVMVPWFRWDKPVSENWLVALGSKALHFDLGKIFPSYNIPGGDRIVVTLLWAMVIAAVNIWVYIATEKNSRQGGEK